MKVFQYNKNNNNNNNNKNNINCFQLNGSASKNGGSGIVNGDVELCYMERREEEMEEAKHLARSNSKSNG